MKGYLTGRTPPFEIVKGGDTDRGGGVIHGTLQWISNDTFEFTAACCGDERKVRHKIGHKTILHLWKSEKTVYTLVTWAAFLVLITGIGITVVIKVFKKKTR